MIRMFLHIAVVFALTIQPVHAAEEKFATTWNDDTQVLEEQEGQLQGEVEEQEPAAPPSKETASDALQGVPSYSDIAVAEPSLEDLRIRFGVEPPRIILTGEPQDELLTEDRGHFAVTKQGDFLFHLSSESHFPIPLGSLARLICELPVGVRFVSGYPYDGNESQWGNPELIGPGREVAFTTKMSELPAAYSQYFLLRVQFEESTARPVEIRCRFEAKVSEEEVKVLSRGLATADVVQLREFVNYGAFDLSPLDCVAYKNELKFAGNEPEYTGSLRVNVDRYGNLTAHPSSPSTITIQGLRREPNDGSQDFVSVTISKFSGKIDRRASGSFQNLTDNSREIPKYALLPSFEKNRISISHFKDLADPSPVESSRESSPRGFLSPRTLPPASGKFEELSLSVLDVFFFFSVDRDASESLGGNATEQVGLFCSFMVQPAMKMIIPVFRDLQTEVDSVRR